MKGHRKINLKRECSCGSEMVSIEGEWHCKKYLANLIKKQRAEKVINAHKKRWWKHGN